MRRSRTSPIASGACSRKLRYGLGGEHPRTLDEVGRTFNVTRERIRQIENRSLKKLQSLAGGPEASRSRLSRLRPGRALAFADRGGGAKARQVAAALGAFACVCAVVASGDHATAQLPEARQSFIVVMTDDQGAGMMRALPIGAAAARRLRGDVQERVRVVPPLLPLAGDLPHRPVRAQPRCQGQYPQQRRRYQSLIDPERNLAAWLDAAGYDTAFAGKWLNGLRSPREPPPGWDEWTGLVEAGGEGLSLVLRLRRLRRARNVAPLWQRRPRLHQTDALTRSTRCRSSRLTRLTPIRSSSGCRCTRPHDGLSRLDAAGRRCSQGRPDERSGGQSDPAGPLREPVH